MGAGVVFQGETAITVDDKGRLAVPTAYRELVARECANRLVIAYNPFELGCLYLYPEKEWQRVRDSVNALPSTQRCLLYTSPSPRDGLLSRMPSSA